MGCQHSAAWPNTCDRTSYRGLEQGVGGTYTLEQGHHIPPIGFEWVFIGTITRNVIYQGAPLTCLPCPARGYYSIHPQ